MVERTFNYEGVCLVRKQAGIRILFTSVKLF